MVRKKINIRKLKSGQRKTIRVLGIFFFTLLFLHIGLYFGSDLLLRNYLQREVEKMSGGKYEIDFDRFNLSILERGFYFQGFTLNPIDESAVGSQAQPFYKVTIPEIGVKNLSYNFSEDILIVGDLNFSQPGVQSRQDKALLEEQRISPLELLEIEIRKSMGEGLNNIIVNNLFIEDADLLLENFISQRSITAENTNLYVKDIQLFAQSDVATPFNAQGFELDLQNFEMFLSDSVHTVKATSVNISSLDRFIKVEKVSIQPDFNKSADIYYEINLDDLELSDADIDQMFYTSDVSIGTLMLNNPEFSLFSGLTAINDSDPANGLYPLIEDILASISIEDLTIVNGKYLQRGIEDANKNRIEAEEINFKMDRVYIGPDESKREDQFFYAQDAEVDISNVKVALADGVHWISGDRVHLSSFEDRISVKDVRVIPIFEEGKEPDITLFEVEVPFISFGNANLKKIYNENILDIDEMMISSPVVLLKDLKANQNIAARSTLQELTKDYLKAIYIKRLEMTEGKLVLDNNLRIRQDSLSFGKISFVLEDFRLDEQVESDESAKIFLAEELQLEIEDYALKLSDNLHLFTAKKILINTKEEFIGIEGFRLKPQHPNNIQNTLNRYSKTTILDIEVPNFYARGVDISEAYFNEKLFISEINVPSPIIKLQIQGSQEVADEENKVDRRDILNLLTSYFSVVKVDAVNVEEGALVFENYGKDKIQTFAENDVSIGITDFYVDEYIDPLDSRVLFAEELDIRLNNYVFNIAEGKYSIVADGISFNSALEEINTFNVRLRPSSTLDAKAVIQADIPNMTIKGVDLEAFLFENTLSLSKLKLSGADVKLSLNRRIKEGESASGIPRRWERNLPKTIEIIKIDTVEAENAKFNVAYREDERNVELINSGVNLSFYGFLLDSAKLVEGDIAAFFSNMSMEIDKFSLSLRDSIHTINFSKVGLNTKGDEIIFDDFTITPKNFIGKKGFPVIDAKIPLVSLKTQSLTSLQSTGDFLIKELLLSKPEIILYLDQDEAVQLDEDQEEQVVQTVIENLNVENFEINEGSLILREKGDAKEVNSFKNLSMILNDLNFDLSSPESLGKKFYLNKNFQFELRDYEVKLPDSLNILKIGLALLSKDFLKLEDVSLFPRYGDYQYTRKVGFQADVAQVHIPEMVFEDINVEKLLGEKILEAGTVRLNDVTVDVFRDKRHELQPEINRGMPQELMMKALVEIKLDSLIVRNGKVVYREFPEKGMIPGELSFTGLNAMMSPFYVSKDPEDYPVTSSNLEAEALLNGEAPMSLRGELFFYEPFPIHIVAEVEEFELSLLNSIVETNAFSTIRRGVVRGGKWQFVADENVAQGNMTLRYNDLKLRLLEERTLERGRGRKNVLTFVINNLAVRSNNPRKIFNRLVKSPIYQERDKGRFIFNYLWKSTLSGVKGSVGLGQPKAPKKEEE
ncbi:MAG: hypothetical protein WD426_03540 [Anditalea sp.]